MSSEEDTSSEKKSGKNSITGSLGFIVGIGVAAKFFVDVSVQLFQPFLPVLAAGMGVSVVTMGRLVSVRNLMGLSAPLFGSLADTIGYKAVMRIGLLLTGLGFLLLAGDFGFYLLLLGMIVSGVGQACYTPTVQAYLSAKLPYTKRARYLGILEYSWALSGIVGLFLIGHLMEWFNWRVPLIILSVGFLVMLLIFGLLPKVEHYKSKDKTSSAKERSESNKASSSASKPQVKAKDLAVRAREFFYLGEHRKSAWAAILINFFNFFAVSHVMIIHGAWLEQEYGLEAGHLGNVALLLGLVDWIASILVSIYCDRIGKKRSVFFGVGGMMIFFALLPFLNVSLTVAVVSIALPRFFFEFATVSNFPLISEQYPAERGKVMALSFSAGLFGPVISGMTGPSFYLQWGVWGLGPVSFLSSLVSLFLLLKFVKEEPYN